MIYRVRAHNTATDSDNKIHDDAVAKAYGFSGGLVPGVDVYAYLCHLPAERWGLQWLRQGSISARFLKPVYDGDEVVVSAADGDQFALHDSGGDLCASAEARQVAEAAEDSTIERGSLPAERLPASAAALAPGTVLGWVGAGFHADQAGAYLDDVRETSTLFRAEGVAHPGWLLRFANTILAANVRLGPWIHVGSDVRFLDLVRDGDHVEARARVVDEYERKGHSFVVLDVALFADGRAVQRVTHAAIYQPRKVDGASTMRKDA